MKKSVSIIEGLLQYLKKDTPVKMCKLLLNDELVCDGVIEFVNLHQKIVEVSVPLFADIENFHENDTVTVKFLLERDNFHLQGTIATITFEENRNLYKIVFSTIKRIYNNRRHQRLSVKCKVNIIRKNPSDDNGSLKNISPIGCCFETDSDLGIEEPVVLGVSDCMHPGLQLQGTIVHKIYKLGKTSYGVVFNNFDEETHNLLSSFIEAIQNDVICFENNIKRSCDSDGLCPS